MRLKPALSIADFVEEPRLVSLVVSPATALGEAVERAIHERWPQVRLHTADPNDENWPSRVARDTTLIIVISSGNLAADVQVLQRIEASISGPPYVLVDESGIRLYGSAVGRRVLTSSGAIDQVIEFLDRRQRSVAQRRFREYRIERLQRKNGRLRQMALEDPLTGLLNRRGFYWFLKLQWARAARYNEPLACIVVDLDNFKGVNDRYGHMVGDWALRSFAGILRCGCRESDIVGRIGGEEFCIMLPSCNERQAFAWAEKTRAKLERTQVYAGGKPLRLTGSFGVAAYRSGLRDEFELIDLADQAMLVAKHHGRNRVAAASSMTGVPAEEPPRTRARLELLATPEGEEGPSRSARIVRLLLESLRIRDASVADHSVRVGHYACMLAQRLGLNENDVWLAENGGMLHDVGKIGVPDEILQKADKLDPAEKSLINQSLKASYDIVRSAFGEGPLAETVRESRTWYRDAATSVHGRQPVTARIVAIADAYDAMTSNTPYRQGLATPAALEELSRCGGSQFDSDLVREFCAIVGERAPV